MLKLQDLLAYKTSINNMLNETIDYGDVSGAIDIDCRYKAHRFNATGNVTLTFINAPVSGINGAITIYATRESLSGSTLSFSQTVSWIGSVLSPELIDVQTTVFSITTTNNGISWFGFANGLVYEATASGLATIWNPSDKNANVTLSLSNKRINLALAGDYYAVRGFGGKTSGKWRIAIRCDLLPVADSNVARIAGVSFGIGVAGAPLSGTSSIPGAMVGTVGLRVGDWIKTGGTVLDITARDDGGAVTTLESPSTITIGDIYGILADLDTGKIWYTKNGSVLGGGDPEAGTGNTSLLDLSGIKFPMASLGALAGAFAGSAGWWYLLNELEDTFSETWASFNTWTA